MFELIVLAERFYEELIPQARELCEESIAEGKAAEAQAVLRTIDGILSRPEHAWRNGH